GAAGMESRVYARVRPRRDGRVVPGIISGPGEIPMKCRFCNSDHTRLFLDLGETALANSFLAREDLGKPEPRLPLKVYFCEDCGLVQIGHVEPPENLFKNYIYFTSTSDLVHRHAQYLAA